MVWILLLVVEYAFIMILDLSSLILMLFGSLFLYFMSPNRVEFWASTLNNDKSRNSSQHVARKRTIRSIMTPRPRFQVETCSRPSRDDLSPSPPYVWTYRPTFEILACDLFLAFSFLFISEPSQSEGRGEWQTVNMDKRRVSGRKR